MDITKILEDEFVVNEDNLQDSSFTERELGYNYSTDGELPDIDRLKGAGYYDAYINAFCEARKSGIKISVMLDLASKGAGIISETDDKYINALATSIMQLNNVGRDLTEDGKTLSVCGKEVDVEGKSIDEQIEAYRNQILLALDHEMVSIPSQDRDIVLHSVLNAFVHEIPELKREVRLGTIRSI